MLLNILFFIAIVIAFLLFAAIIGIIVLIVARLLECLYDKLFPQKIPKDDVRYWYEMMANLERDLLKRKRAESKSHSKTRP